MPRRLYVERSALAHDIVWECRSAGVEVRDVVDGGLAKVLDLTTPQAMVAVAEVSTVGVEDLTKAAVDAQRPLLVLVALSDPGNVGTSMRVAEAAGAVGVVLTEGSADVFNPKTVRASAGSLFRVPVSQGATLNTVVANCSATGLATWATVVAGGTTLEDVALGGAGALLIGAEAHGLDAIAVGASSVSVSIPMAGQTESLNAGVAAAVVLFEAARQRRAEARDRTGVGPE